MIIYDNLWKTMKKKNVTQYKMINEYGISAGQLSRLRNNDPVSTRTLDKLCDILDCKIDDIVTYKRK